MEECYQLAANGELQCYGFFLNALGMFDDMEDTDALRNTFLTAIITLPLLLLTVISTVILLFVLLCMTPKGCVHREFGIPYCIFVLITLATDNLMRTFLTHSLPWMGSPAIEFTVISHAKCKILSFLSSFLSACRANLLLANCLVHIFSVELRAERKAMTFTMCLFNSVCILIAANFGLFSFLVHGVWTISNRFICLPDPEWPWGVIVFYMIHEAIFCDGIAQGIVILVACHHIRGMRRQIRPTATCMRFTSESSLPFFTVLAKQRVKLLRRDECFRVVLYHSAMVAVVKICMGILRIAFCCAVYGYERASLSRSSGRNMIVYYNAIFDIFYMLEMAANMLHGWFVFYWQMTMRNTFLKGLFKMCRPFKRMRVSIMRYMYTDDVDQVNREPEKKNAKGKNATQPTVKVDERYIDYLNVLSAKMNVVKLRTLFMWLEDQPNIPKELETFTETLFKDYYD